jgi:thiol-disulfide isomerase/thioredoxin
MQHQAHQLMRTSAIRLLMLFAALTLSSCSRTEDQNAHIRYETAQPASENPIVVRPINESALKALIRERRGKMLLLNIWATWCAPCVAEFPDLVKCSQAFDTSAVEVVAISADYPDEIESKIIPFLRKVNVPFRVYVAQFDRQEDFINAVNPKWSGALPASLIYDKQGIERFFHVGQQSYDDFMSQIQKIKGDL